jgi:hypothetical protein
MWVFFLCVCETGSHYVPQAGLKLMIILPQPPECWSYKPVPPHPASWNHLWCPWVASYCCGFSFSDLLTSLLFPSQEAHSMWVGLRPLPSSHHSLSLHQGGSSWGPNPGDPSASIQKVSALPFLDVVLHICGRPDFLHIIQAGQHVTTAVRQKSIWESHSLPLNHIWNRSTKRETRLLHSRNVLCLGNFGYFSLNMLSRLTRKKFIDILS